MMGRKGWHGEKERHIEASRKGVERRRKRITVCVWVDGELMRGGTITYGKALKLIEQGKAKYIGDYEITLTDKYKVRKQVVMK